MHKLIMKPLFYSNFSQISSNAPIADSIMLPVSCSVQRSFLGITMHNLMSDAQL